jgi:hypothetical protein
MALFLPGLSWIWGGRDVFTVSPAAYAMRLPLWLFALFAISQTWLNHTRFASADWRLFLRIAVKVAALALAIFLYRAGELLVPGANWDPFRDGRSLATLNRMVSGSLVLVSLLSALGCIQELRRFVQRLGRHRQAADAAS